MKAEATAYAADLPATLVNNPDAKTLSARVWWKRIWAHRRLTHYNRLIFLVGAINLWVAASLTQGWSQWPELFLISTAVLVNFSIAVLIRQQYVINGLFSLATSVPLKSPLWLRWLCGKVYHFGGLHVGAAVSATAWFATLTSQMIWQWWQGATHIPVALIVINLVLFVLLISIFIMALPPVRSRYHDAFERTLRFGGWLALALVWAHTVMLIDLKEDIKGVLILSLVNSMPFWLLLAVTISIALPWLRLKKLPVRIETPSSHVAIARFNYGVTPFAGSSTAISRSPLWEWHSFANVPTPGKDGFRLTVSRAGDWTGKFIDDKPEYVWVKGIPTAGVANIEVLFKKVLYIATGSGIGPCLPHLLAKKVPSTLVWSTRSPRLTYGDDLVNEILTVQPEALIWDTNEKGKPNMLELAYQSYVNTNAEAVICISNKKLTWQVVCGLEKMGVPAFGAIFDS